MFFDAGDKVILSGDLLKLGMKTVQVQVWQLVSWYTKPDSSCQILNLCICFVYLLRPLVAQCLIFLFSDIKHFMTSVLVTRHINKLTIIAYYYFAFFSNWRIKQWEQWFGLIRSPLSCSPVMSHYKHADCGHHSLAKQTWDGISKMYFHLLFFQTPHTVQLTEHARVEQLFSAARKTRQLTLPHGPDFICSPVFSPDLHHFRSYQFSSWSLMTKAPRFFCFVLKKSILTS